MFRVFVLLLSSVITSGCASAIGTFYHRPVVEDSIKDLVSTVSLSADRRTVVVVTEGENRGKFCAEPPPDVATALKTDLDATLGKVAAKDKFETTVTVVAERTASLDFFRTGVYALCQAHLNGAISGKDVEKIFVRLIDAFSASEQGKTKVTATSSVK